MTDLNWKIWLMLVAALLGVSFEVFKRTQTHDSVIWDVENLHLAKIQPYSVPEAAIKPSVRVRKLPPVQPSHALQDAYKSFVTANQPHKTEFNKKLLEAKKGDADEWEEVIDPKTGKKIRRKKKKDAKKDEKKAEVAAAQPVAPQTPQEPATPSADSGDNSVVGGGQAAVTPQPFTSLQQWQQLLLTNPNPAETRIFIQQYQENLVSAEIFYSIVGSMITDSRSDMKELGLLCLSSTPSVSSFQLLASLEKTEPSNSSIRQEATGLLARYANMGEIRTLQSVIAGSDAYTQMVATQELDRLVRIYRASSASTSNNPSAQSVTTATSASTSAAAASFRPFVGLLQSLTTSSNTLVSQQARATLADINSLLGTSTVASTHTP